MVLNQICLKSNFSAQPEFVTGRLRFKACLYFAVGYPS